MQRGIRREQMLLSLDQMLRKFCPTTTLSKIIKRYKNIQESGLVNSLSEIDTQLLLVEPIISLAGWDLHNPIEVKREDSDSNFDIQVYEPISKNLKIAIECKSLKSDHFNIDKINNGIGALLRTDGKDIYEQNKTTDGVAQLRRYCIKSSHFKKANLPLPVLTNGYKWVIFSPEFFNDEANFENNINQKMVSEYEAIDSTEFTDRIVKKLKK